jgi:hypothetical protein
MTFKAEEYTRRSEEIHGWAVNISTYRLRDTWLCKIDNNSPGATVSRGEGTTREEAEKEALDAATRRLASTKRLIEARKAIDEVLSMMSEDEIEAAKRS